MVLAMVGSVCTATRADEAGSPRDAAPGADSVRAALSSVARAFDEAALRVNDSQPSDLVRWSQRIYLAVDAAGDLRPLEPQISHAVSQLAEIAGVPVDRVALDDPRRNFVVRQADPAGRAACRTAIYSQGGHIVRVEVEIYLASNRALTRCINHEALHGFGFRSHPQAAPSILSYRATDLAQISATDRLLLETLYDSRLRPGMPVVAAARTACVILSQKLGAPIADADAVCASRTPADGRVAAFGRPHLGPPDLR